MNHFFVSEFAVFRPNLVTEMIEARRAIIMLAVEKTLLDFGKSTYDLVVKRFEEKYHAYLSDCYEHPNYIRVVLKDLFGKSAEQMLETIGENLKESSDIPQIRRFLDSLSQ